MLNLRMPTKSKKTKEQSSQQKGCNGCLTWGKQPATIVQAWIPARASATSPDKLDKPQTWNAWQVGIQTTFLQVAQSNPFVSSSVQANPTFPRPSPLRWIRHAAHMPMDFEP